MDNETYENLMKPGPEKYKLNYKSVDRHVAIPTYYKAIKEKPREYVKTNDPNPFSYKFEESFDKT